MEPSLPARLPYLVCAPHPTCAAGRGSVGWSPLEARIPTAWRRLLLFVLAALPFVVLAFLVSCDFFGAFHGKAVSTRPPRSDNPASYTVLIANDDGTRVEREWPADLVRGLALPVDALAIPPAEISDLRPLTVKSRYTLQFGVKAHDATTWTDVPTTSPRGIGAALLTLLVLVAVRNMVVAGSPFAIEPRPAFLPKAQPPSGQITPRATARGHKGPPPPRPRKGRGRR